MDKRLIRSKSDRMIGGVCGGLGDYFDVDSNIIRLIFVAFTLFGGSGVLVYIVLWIVVPEENKTSYFEDVTSKDNKMEGKEKVKGAADRFASEIKDAVKNDKKRDGRTVLAITLIFLGLIFLLNNFISVSHFIRLWPLILIIIGLSIMFSTSERS